MATELPWPTPGTCWRQARDTKSQDVDRWRLHNDGRVHGVYADGTVRGTSGDLGTAILNENKGVWIRVPDAPLDPPIPYFGEPWYVYPNDYIREMGGEYAVPPGPEGHVRRQRGVTCVNAMAGIRNPQAVRDLIDWLKTGTRPTGALEKLLDAIDRDPKP